MPLADAGLEPDDRLLENGCRHSARWVKMLFIVSYLIIISEIALLAYVGQAILFILAGDKRDGNFVFKLLKMITAPMTAAVRFISPRIILDRHIPLAAFLLLFMLRIGLKAAKIQILMQTP